MPATDVVGTFRVLCLAALVCWPLAAAAEDAPPAGAPPAAAVGAPAPPSPSGDTPVAPAAAAAPKADGAPQTGAAPDPAATTEAKSDGPGDTDTREAMCLMIESAARANDLPLEFFARVIWQESRFQADAVGPVTRSGARAQGIAQFMPGTANERRLLDPFDPVQALPKSAEFLAELRGQFGNLGLAAAAYNAGPRRVQDWLAGSGAMPAETRRYVLAITGLSVEEWRDAGTKPAPVQPPPGCRALMALLRQAPNPFIAQLEQRVKLGVAQPWGVQLAAGFSRDRALAMYARAMQRLGTVIGEHDANLLSSVLRSRGTRPFYQVRVGMETRPAADDLCGRIRRAGQACFVLRNSQGHG
ncbi:lytic transglycosylase domain-containing protein [Bradyrhizobium sp. U87765 SZCCT0131]|uniref:lytic transglycosylase domain-containing protein n=1 Tax=unclassified Bradyrhizobium TaxID=2631580 RepID=UPI001BA652A7|nr:MULTISPECIES: lytic transglycosylase domain-containing protein [unclassified Bradyrhizobium]MBR1223231.1 lytic transglycosylase domain-containing protein [Bradyrhizobium sp. U87765 SZCCT0131]MBR1265799.1 lytic transglycosylase domain-containing protein [Bradyrhizobium sp. U87765 SZCCT0134]MBR1309230.1 lytic transglycosylase domain-containing protein [Bradyrhizobium sp. U87765 SZCCT0110]MBR1323191.1 lytic transglycosylase domain-containing protein [Bradyrhizobium sp. U87765 SZCCT0109]MBR1352